MSISEGSSLGTVFVSRDKNVANLRSEEGYSSKLSLNSRNCIQAGKVTHTLSATAEKAHQIGTSRCWVKLP
jgi:hypothetical protein